MTTLNKLELTLEEGLKEKKECVFPTTSKKFDIPNDYTETLHDKECVFHRIIRISNESGITNDYVKTLIGYCSSQNCCKDDCEHYITISDLNETITGYDTRNIKVS